MNKKTKGQAKTRGDISSLRVSFFMPAAHLGKKGEKNRSFAEEISNPLEESKKRRYNIKDYGMSVKGVEKWAAEGWGKC